MTVREALTQGNGLLKMAGIETSSLDASLLLAHVLDTSRTALVAASPDPLSQEALASFRSLIDRRLDGECTAYILGRKEFRGLEFLVNPHVLVPRPDTEILVETAIERVGNGEWGMGNGEPIRVLDLCTGCGSIAIAIKNERPELEVWATDISPEALDTAKKNAARLLGGRFLPGTDTIHFYLGDLYDALPSPLAAPSLPTTNNKLQTASLFSLIVTNPPYIPSSVIQALPAEVQKEPHLALDGGPSGLETIKRIIDGAPDNLLHGGALLIEADPSQIKDIGILLEKRGFHGIIIYRDLSGQERVIGGIL